MTVTGVVTAVNRVCSALHCCSYINTIITCIIRDYITTHLATADNELPIQTHLLSPHIPQSVSQGCRHRCAGPCCPHHRSIESYIIVCTDVLLSGSNGKTVRGLVGWIYCVYIFFAFCTAQSLDCDGGDGVIFLCEN